MHKHLLRLFIIPICLIYLCLGLSSCLTLKDVKLFQDIPDSTKIANIKLPKFTPPVIQPNDILSILVLTTDPAAAANINLANAFTPATPVTAGVSGTSSSSGSDGGYLVDKQGFIEMPVIGKISVAGLTITQAQDAIRKQASVYLTNPVILVKSKNLKITILGEVQRPGTYNVANEKVTIMDLIAYSGDFTAVGRRDNILLLRQSDDNTLAPVRLNLKQSSVLRSPYYYLQNNDVVYVEPTKGKAATSDAVFSRNISYITIGLTFITTFLVLIKR